jgi:hypothetical protein
VGSFVRRVKTASGATAVQIVHKRGRVVQGIDHVGSAHDADQLALLEQVARERLHAGQHVLQFSARSPPTGPVPARQWSRRPAPGCSGKP